MATIEKQKNAYLVRALGNTLVDQSSWLVLLGLCGRSSKMCQNRTFRPLVGYDNDDVIGPKFFCELIGSMSSFFKIKFCSTREKPHPTVSCYLNLSLWTVLHCGLCDIGSLFSTRNAWWERGSARVKRRRDPHQADTFSRSWVSSWPRATDPAGFKSFLSGQSLTILNCTGV